MSNDMFSHEQYWNTVRNYDSEVTSIFSNKSASAAIINEIKDVITPEAIVADLGTGIGNLLPYLSTAKQVWAVDRSPNMLHQAKEAHSSQSNVRFVCSSIGDLKLPSKLDLAVSISSLLPQRFSDFEKDINGILGNLKPCGQVIILIPSFEARLYYSNLKLAYFIEILGLSESEAYRRITSYHSQYMNNLLGHIRGYSDTPTQKYWIKEEFEERLINHGLTDLQTKKYLLPWNSYFKNVGEWYRTKPPMWMWLVTAKRPQNLPLTIKAHHARYIANRVINAEPDAPELIRHLTNSSDIQAQLLEMVNFNQNHHAWHFSDYVGRFSDGEHQHSLSVIIRNDVINGSFFTSTSLAILDSMQKAKAAYLKQSK